VPYRKCGKLVVATSEAQLGALADLRARAIANGVADVVLLDREAARAMEPAVACAGAMHSPSSGIVDSHALMLALLGEAEAAGAMLALNAPLESGRVAAHGIEVAVGGDAPMTLACGTVINAAGLGARAVARAIAGVPADTVPPLNYAKGSYFRLAGRSPFSRLVYPMPEPGGLGVHVTIDLGGQAKFGPDVEWVDAPDYDVDPDRGARFEAAIRRYFPALPDDALVPDYAGVRPKIVAPGEPAADFRIDGPEVHGVPGLVNLFGIESPGLTASLAIAEHVAARLGAIDGAGLAAE
jgi:L-2-hydroxyglutarate oxidase LhgO